MSFVIRRLHPDDAPLLVVLRRQALEGHPLAFSSSIETDRGVSVDLMRASLADLDEHAVFGCFDGGSLVGMAGIHRAGALKRRHKSHIWGMYVSPVARGRGAGRALLEAAIEQASAWPGVEEVQLSVTDAAPEARKIYETVGFHAWGREPRSLQWEGRFVDELYLFLDLQRRGPARAR